MDEMKIDTRKPGWDKHNGQLKGYVALGDIDLNNATLSKVTTAASHILIFLIYSIVNPFKFKFSKFCNKWHFSFSNVPTFKESHFYM